MRFGQCLTQNPKLLARDNRAWSAAIRYSAKLCAWAAAWFVRRTFRGAHPWGSHFMTRDDWLFWFSIVWFVGLCVTAGWLLLVA